VAVHDGFPAMRRVNCILNYAFLFTGMVQFPAYTRMTFKLTKYIHPKLQSLIAKGKVSISLRPYVVYEITKVPAGPTASPCFGDENDLPAASSGHVHKMTLGFGFPVLYLVVTLRPLDVDVSGIRLPVVTQLTFVGDENQDLTFVRRDEQLLRWTDTSNETSSVLMMMTSTSVLDTSQLFEDIFIERRSINCSMLQRVDLLVEVDNPDMVAFTISVESFHTNVFKISNLVIGLAYCS